MENLHPDMELNDVTQADTIYWIVIIFIKLKWQLCLWCQAYN